MTYYFDMDGVLANFHKAYALDKATACKRSAMANLEPFAENVSAVRSLIASGVQVYILTKAANEDGKAGKIDWLAKFIPELTAEQFMRECESKWTGSIENPIIKDADVQKSRVLKVMEDKHCGDPDVFYVLGYDVSFRDRSGNAMTAMAVVKCSRQFHTEKKDYYRKQLVYVELSSPMGGYLLVGMGRRVP
jgi:hypothetical protein